MKSKGFTMIELLAVITIMGFLAVIGIISVSSIIENSRKDAYVELSRSYINSVRDAVSTGRMNCVFDDFYGFNNSTFKSNMGPDGTYYYYFDSSVDSSLLLEKGGLSPWGKANIKGYVAWDKVANVSSDYRIYIIDTGKHAISLSENGGYVSEENLSKDNVFNNFQFELEQPTLCDNITGLCRTGVYPCFFE